MVTNNYEVILFPDGTKLTQAKDVRSYTITVDEARKEILIEQVKKKLEQKMNTKSFRKYWNIGPMIDIGDSPQRTTELEQKLLRDGTDDKNEAFNKTGVYDTYDKTEPTVFELRIPVIGASKNFTTYLVVTPSPQPPISQWLRSSQINNNIRQDILSEAILRTVAQVRPKVHTNFDYSNHFHHQTVLNTVKDNPEVLKKKIKGFQNEQTARKSIRKVPEVGKALDKQ